MKYFGMPSDFKKETIDKYVMLNNLYKHSKIFETYGQITSGNTFGSGRESGTLPCINFSELKEYIDYSNKFDIGFNYTFNASFIGNYEFTREGISEISSFLTKLYDSGVRSLTITMPSLIELASNLKCKFDIKASTICQIDNVNKALWYKGLGVNRIVLAESIVRDFDKLRKISSSFGENVEIIINSICHMDCINRSFHYNQISCDSINPTSKASEHFFYNRCLERRFSDISSFLKIGWVRPEDIKYYTETGIKYFKLQGRHLVSKGDPARTVECYMKESFEGNLLELLDMFATSNTLDVFLDNSKLNGFIEPYFTTPNFCKQDCSSCNYCKEFSARCINCEEAQKIAEVIGMYFSETDEFKKAIRELETHTG